MSSRSSNSGSDSINIQKWKYLATFLKPHGLTLALAVTAIALDALLTVCRPWPLKVVLDFVISTKHHHSRVPIIGDWLYNAGLDPTVILYGACVISICIGISTGLLTYFFTFSFANVGRHTIYGIRRDLFAYMQRLSLRFHDRQRIGDLITRLTSDAQSIQEVFSRGIILLFSNALLLLGMMILMFWLNWQFALVSLSMAPILFWTLFRYTSRIRNAARVARKSDGLLASTAQETLSSIRVVQGLSLEDQREGLFDRQNITSMTAHLEASRYQARVAPIVDILAATGLALVMWYGATRIYQGVLTTGDVVVFFAYVTNLYAPMKALSKLTYTFSKAGVALERIAQIHAVEREVVDRAGAVPAPVLNGDIEFRDVTFEYEPGHPVLSNVNLRIRAGEKVAIVGATGAGKSTLVSLIPRLYDVTGGAILINGRDIRDYKLQSLREQISLVLQDSLLFSGTIAENIAFGRPDATREQIEEAARRANAEEFILKLPDGYDSLVTERGLTLSGGQKQRIAIARAILRDAPILILDEPTSGLDIAAERVVLEALLSASEGRTTLIISHRLMSLQFVDRVLEVHDRQVFPKENPKRMLSSAVLSLETSPGSGTIPITKEDAE
jgi:subfamily B ATP-binding cassette protein MsbA